MRVAGPSRFARRRSWRDVEFVSLDFEATGLDFARDVIVSFGVVPVRGGRVVLADACISSSIPTSRRPCPRRRCTSSGRRTWRALPGWIRHGSRSGRRSAVATSWCGSPTLRSTSYRRSSAERRAMAAAHDRRPQPGDRGGRGPSSARTASVRLHVTGRADGGPGRRPARSVRRRTGHGHLFLALRRTLSRGAEPTVGDLVRAAQGPARRVEQRFKLAV